MTVGFVTLDVGQQALVYNLQGIARIEKGPKRMFLWREKIKFLSCMSANQNQFLVVKHRSGKVEHIPGPVARFEDPLVHQSICVRDAIALDANEVLVVYKRSAGAVSRYLQHGPCVFVPDSNEWLHEFSWHGTDPENKTKKIPGSYKFTKLQVIPDQFYYNVPEVRTSDDALIRVKLMIFYELTDIELMLNNTQDPIADFINCMCADVVAFCSRLTYMEFIEQSDGLNERAHYPQLTDRCAQIGYSVGKVVFRGYYASPKLQEMHDNTIMARNKLKIAYETEEQQQIITDLNLSNERDRMELEQGLELEKLEHKHSMQMSTQEHKLLLLKKEKSGECEQRRRREAASLEALMATDLQDVTHLRALHGLGVDITQYLLSQNPQPDRVISIVSGGEGGAANVHLHHS